MKIVIGNMAAIYRRELLSYFASPLAYSIAGVFWLLCGGLYWIVLNSTLLISQDANLRGQSLDAPYIFLQDFMGILGFISLFILPILSMGLYTEERKRGTLELLATSPITNWAVALGKLLGVVTFYLAIVLPVLLYVGITLNATTPPITPPVLLSGLLGLVLMAACMLSLGMFISSITDSTILAAILTFVLVLFLWLIDGVSKNLTGPLGQGLGHLSLLRHYANLIQGIFDTSSLILFASYILLGLFLTAQSIEALRFQRS
ncbi:MAG: ABC transporter permease [Leptolyngbyaceae cyanobacterium bins.59]|nr:ABC transporter permease [Leptolyngbyaceae cyanobacterium bins.59]